MENLEYIVLCMLFESVYPIMTIDPAYKPSLDYVMAPMATTIAITPSHQ